MLNPKLIDKLSEQMAVELDASHMYLQASAWCSVRGFEGCSQFLKRQSDEEKDHMYRLYDYILQTGGLPVLRNITAPRKDYDSLMELFEDILEVEREVSRKINDLVDACLEIKDHSTFNFLQWYVAEQHQEEHLFSSILDKFKLIGTDTKSLFFVDREIGQMRGEEVV